MNRLCSSGLQAVRSVAQAIEAGEIELGVAVGIESMSLKYVRLHCTRAVLLTECLSPRPSPEVSAAVSQNIQADDCTQPMGWTSELVAQHYKISRETQDKYALISHSRAEKVCMVILHCRAFTDTMNRHRKLVSSHKKSYPWRSVVLSFLLTTPSDQA